MKFSNIYVKFKKKSKSTKSRDRMVENVHDLTREDYLM